LNHSIFSPPFFISFFPSLKRHLYIYVMTSKHIFISLCFVMLNVTKD
jgi:hypothetical protein